MKMLINVFHSNFKVISMFKISFNQYVINVRLNLKCDDKMWTQKLHIEKLYWKIIIKFKMVQRHPMPIIYRIILNFIIIFNDESSVSTFCHHFYMYFTLHTLESHLTRLRIVMNGPALSPQVNRPSSDWTTSLRFNITTHSWLMMPFIMMMTREWGWWLSMVVLVRWPHHQSAQVWRQRQRRLHQVWFYSFWKLSVFIIKFIILFLVVFTEFTGPMEEQFLIFYKHFWMVLSCIMNILI